MDNIDAKQIDNIVLGGENDYPDFSDAYIESADYKGKPMTQSQLDAINEDREFVFEAVEMIMF